MTIEKLEQAVIRWANDRDLYLYSTDVTRLKKMAEEFEELEEAVMNDQADDIILEAGDVLVTIINLLHPMGLDLETCLAAAYEKISKRTGKMINGTYVKSEDLNEQS